MGTVRFLGHLLVVFILAMSSAHSANKKSKTPSRPKQTSIVVNMDDGSVAHFEGANKKIYPASLTKLMTVYLTFDAVKKGKLKLAQKLKTSKAAAKMKPCKLGLGVGQRITVDEAIDALIVRSANDAAVVLAEAIAGDEKRFASLMTRKARKLGMSSTTFKNASGWHHKDQKSTAIDMAKLAIALKRDYPQYYNRFAKTKFVFNGQTVYGHNKVTKQYAGAEGMKTGYTSHAGYNLVTTASRDGTSLVAVVTGGPTSAKRNKKTMDLLDKGFDVSSASHITLAQNGTSSNTKKLVVVDNKRHLKSAAKLKPAKKRKLIASKKQKSRDAFAKLGSGQVKRVASNNKKSSLPSSRRSATQKRSVLKARLPNRVSHNPPTHVVHASHDAFSMLGS